MFNFLKKKIKVNNPDNKSVSGVGSYNQFLIDRDSFRSKLAQKIQDDKISIDIIKEANRCFQEWLNTPTTRIAGKDLRLWIIVPRNIYPVYYIHDYESAKFRKTGISKLISEEFHKLMIKKKKKKKKNK